jgi:hypothetical protein
VNRLANYNRINDRVTGLLGLTYGQKTKECNLIFEYFGHLLTMVDIGLDIFQKEGSLNVRGAELPYYVCSLTNRNYLEMEACLLDGSYHSAARSLRWLYEMNLVGTTACVDASLLDDKYSPGPLSLQEFENLLERLDSEDLVIGRKKRKHILDQFGLPSEELAVLFSDLCKYVHLSKVSFDKDLDWPNLQFLPEKFDEVFKTALRTIDLVFWMESRLCLCFNNGTKGAIKNLFIDPELLELLPMTNKLILSL